MPYSQMRSTPFYLFEQSHCICSLSRYHFMLHTIILRVSTVNAAKKSLLDISFWRWVTVDQNKSLIKICSTSFSVKQDVEFLKHGFSKNKRSPGQIVVSAVDTSEYPFILPKRKAAIGWLENRTRLDDISTLHWFFY